TASNSANDANYVFKNFSLQSSANNNPNFKIRFECTTGAVSEFCRVDNVMINGTAIDNTPPNYFNLSWPNSPINYSVTNIYYLNATWIDNIAIDEVILEFNGMNYSYKNAQLSKLGNIYYRSFSGLASGIYYYKWYANDTRNNKNSTYLMNLTINKATPLITLSAFPSWNESYSIETKINCSVNTNELILNLYRNNVSVAIPDIKILGAGVYNYSCNTSGNQNYTSFSLSNTLTINKAQTTTNLLINGNSSNLTVVYGTLTNVSAVTSAGIVTLYRNGNVIDNPEIRVLSAGIYNYSAINLGNENYSSSNKTLFLTVNKANTIVNLSLNGNESNLTLIYPQQLTARYSTNFLEATMYRNGMNVTNENNISLVLGVGGYNYSVINNGNENYSASSKTYYVSVQQNTSYCLLKFDKTSPQNYGNEINASCSCTNQEASAKLFRDNIDVTSSENNKLVLLGAGNYSYVCNVSATQNYTNASNSSLFVINKANSEIRLLLNNSDSNISVVVNSLVNISANLIKGNGKIKLYKNDNLINDGTNAAENITLFNESGIYNITAIYETTENYSASSKTLFVIVQDNVPPGSISNLTNLHSGANWIFWNWINPNDSDFYQAIIYINGVNVINTSNNFYNATGLNAHTNYTILVHTKDINNNINYTNVSLTSSTINSVPIALNVSVIPSNPTINNNISCNYSYYDADNDAENGTILRWYKNGILRLDLLNERILLVGNTTKEDLWKCEVIPNDGIDFGNSANSSEIIILNSIPSVINVSISATENNKTNGTIFASWFFFDYDIGDFEQLYEIKWYKNNIFQSLLSNFTFITGGNTSKNEAWYFSIRVFDGTNWSHWVNSSNLIIRNSPPMAPVIK
ncbi:MAG: hypothetical protein N3D20_03325, partial [Candidatus Pacearchaeota archaeon]|nr:hypothetical protein [Candidatus Pacearchaeota archaeon]